MSCVQSVSNFFALQAHCIVQPVHLQMWRVTLCFVTKLFCGIGLQSPKRMVVSFLCCDTFSEDEMHVCWKLTNTLFKFKKQMRHSFFQNRHRSLTCQSRQVFKRTHETLSFEGLNVNKADVDVSPVKAARYSSVDKTLSFEGMNVTESVTSVKLDFVGGGGAFSDTNDVFEHK